MSRSYNPLDYIPHLIVACFIAMPLLLVVCAIDQGFGSDKVLDTWAGTKSVCAEQKYNYSLKHTQCVRYQSVPATCKKVEHTGPIFGTFTNDRCE
jgi:hypothetical protein